MEIRQLLLDSLITAAKKDDIVDTIGRIHRNRSKNFVEALAASLRQEYKSQKSVFVLSKHFYDNKDTFGLNELLFDVLVCDTSTVISARRKKRITYVTKALWQIESEFARDSQEAVYDFNKLVLGSSENKLFIGTEVDDVEGYLKTMAELAKLCNSNIFIALMPYPSEWKSKKLDIRFWEYKDSGWIEKFK